MKIKTFFSARAAFICVAIFFFCAFASSAFAIELPRAQLDESERHFTEAYRRFLARDYWRALDALTRALRVNIYFVDFYLMQGLILNRIGDFGAGRESLEYYLEVRPMDVMVPRILDYSIGQRRALQRIVSPAPVPVQWRASRVDLQNEFDLGHMRAFSVRGMGKAAMQGRNLFLADTIGNRVIHRENTSRRINIIDVDSPVAVLPMGDGSFHIMSAAGRVYHSMVLAGIAHTFTPELRGILENTFITDAVMISANEFVVADTVTREVAFYSLATLTGQPVTEHIWTWSPPDNGGALFEPVALSAYGQWLAVADRGGGNIFFLNLANRREFFSAELPRPRDVAWSALGELFVITEDGDLFKITADFRDGRVESADRLKSELTDGWALFNTPDGDVYCIDISGSRLWKAVPFPDTEISLGAVALSAPSIKWEEGTESILLNATLMSPFRTFSRTSPMVGHVAWNNRAIRAFAEWNPSGAERMELLLFNRPVAPGAVNSVINSVVVENSGDIRAALPSVWSGRALTNIIIDSTVDMTAEDLKIITLFCLNNGVELNVWARSVPSVELVRAAGLTGGSVIFSLTNQPDLSLPNAEVLIRIPLPYDLSSSGFPSRSMLSLFLNVGLMHTRNWIPLWPDMFDF